MELPSWSCHRGAAIVELPSWSCHRGAAIVELPSWSCHRGAARSPFRCPFVPYVHSSCGFSSCGCSSCGFVGLVRMRVGLRLGRRRVAGARSMASSNENTEQQGVPAAHSRRPALSIARPHCRSPARTVDRPPALSIARPHCRSPAFRSPRVDLPNMSMLKSPSWGCCRGAAVVGLLSWGCCRGAAVVGLLSWGCCRGAAVVGLLSWGCCRGAAVVGLLSWGCCRGAAVVGLLSWGCSVTVAVLVRSVFPFELRVHGVASVWVVLRLGCRRVAVSPAWDGTRDRMKIRNTRVCRRHTAERRAPSAERRASSVERRASSVERRTIRASNVECRRHTAERRTSNPERRMPTAAHHRSRPPTIDRPPSIPASANPASVSSGGRRRWMPPQPGRRSGRRCGASARPPSPTTAGWSRAPAVGARSGPPAGPAG